MKYGKYVVAMLAIAALATCGALVASHHGQQKETSSAKIKHDSTEKSASTKKSSTSNKTSSSSVEPQASTSPANSSDSAVSSVIASSDLPTGNTDTTDTQVTADSQNDGSNVPYDNGDPNTDLHAFINKYGTTPAGWLVQNKGMSVKDALAATPNTMQTSGEIQDEYMYDQGQDPVQAYQDVQNSGDVQENANEGTQPIDDNTGW